MEDFYLIPKTCVIRGDIAKTYRDIRYLVFFFEQGYRGGIHVCSKWSEDGEMLRVSAQFERWLCGTLEELHDMTEREIEYQAYCSFMDGAR